MTGYFKSPVGMCPVKVGINTYHLGLDPDTEIKAYSVHGFHEVVQALGELFGIDLPVAERCSVIVPLAEPSVIHDEEFDSDCPCPRGKFHEFRLADFEV